MTTSAPIPSQISTGYLKPKPTDNCPGGDKSGNSTDGSCDPRPKDHCPGGDYSGSDGDGSCGTPPKPQPIDAECHQQANGNGFEVLCTVKTFGSVWIEALGCPEGRPCEKRKLHAAPLADNRGQVTFRWNAPGAKRAFVGTFSGGDVTIEAQA